MLATAENLEIYLQAAYNHFANNQDGVFNFTKEALKHRPVSGDLKGNISNLALAIQNNADPPTNSNMATIFGKMVNMIASCIMLDSARHSLPGAYQSMLTPSQILFIFIEPDNSLGRAEDVFMNQTH